MPAAYQGVKDEEGLKASPQAIKHSARRTPTTFENVLRALIGVFAVVIIAVGIYELVATQNPSVKWSFIFNVISASFVLLMACWWRLHTHSAWYKCLMAIIYVCLGIAIGLTIVRIGLYNNDSNTSKLKTRVVIEGITKGASSAGKNIKQSFKDGMDTASNVNWEPLALAICDGLIGILYATWGWYEVRHFH